MEIEKTYEHLLKFDDSLLTVGEPILDDRLEVFEKKYNLKLTAEFRYILKKHNGFGMYGNEVLGLGEEFKAGSLDKYYELMHKYFQDFIPKEFVPISRDGWGNYYCLDLSRTSRDICPIIFWQHDYEYTGLSDVETCNNSLAEWINELMITPTLDEYTYNGENKDGIIFKTRKFLNTLFSRQKGSH